MQNFALAKQALAATALTASLGMPAALAAQQTDRPNFIVIFTDDHGWPDIGAQGILDDIRTPNVDLLARNGVLATDGYATAPQCVPSRGGIMTSIYQNRFGLELNPDPLDGFNATTTIPQYLQRAGYVTGMAGKWHLGPNSEIDQHGFDYVHHRNSNRPALANFDTRTGERFPMREVPLQQYHIDSCSDAAVTFIRKNADQPFFFYLAYRAPHVPLDAPPKYLSRFPGEMPERRRQALAMISAMDDGVGNIMAALREQGLEENTLIFYIADNGAPLKMFMEDAPGGGPGWDGSVNDPLNGEKGMLSEGGVRVPFVVYWKGVLGPGTVYRHAITTLDVGATALAAAGLPVPADLDGKNILPYLRGEITTRPHDAVYWRWLGQAAIRKGAWKYLRAGDTYQYLFNLEEDPEELDNLIDSQPAIANALLAELRTWANTLPNPGLPDDVPDVYHTFYRFYFEGEREAMIQARAEGRPVHDRAGRGGGQGPRLSLDDRMNRFRQRDVNRDNVVTLEEWIADRDLTPAQRETVIRTFESLDLDGDGVWTLEEARGNQDAAPASPPPARPRQGAGAAGRDAEALRLFQQRDKNNDGVVTLEEFIAGRDLTPAQLRVVTRNFEERDKDGDGRWTLDEID